jgi:hypothetical protein
MEAGQAEVIVNGRRNSSYLAPVPAKILSVAGHPILHDEAFRRMLNLERKRAQRSQKPFLLALLEVDNQLASQERRKTLDGVLSLLPSMTRDTDVIGWSKENCALGVMFTEIGTEGRSSTVAAITSRVVDTLRNHLSAQQFGQVVISFHVFPPEEKRETILPRPSSAPLYSPVLAGDEARRLG